MVRPVFCVYQRINDLIAQGEQRNGRMKAME